ncbi:MAG: glycosyltransferase [Christensenellales bacterium]
MKILLVIDHFDDANNGTIISTRRFARILESHGHQVRVVSTGLPGEGKYVVPRLSVPGFNNIIKKQGMVLARPDGAVLARAVAWADIVHFLMPFWLSVAGKKIADEMGVPNTAAFHIQAENISYNLGMGKLPFANKLIYWALKRYFYDGFGHVHCPSAFMASELAKNGYASKLHVISNGVDEGFEYRKLEKDERFRGKFVITMIGRLSSEKRQDVLIRAALRSRYAENIQLVLAGKGPREKKYRRLARDLPRPMIVDFYSADELKDVLAMTDLYVHASDAESEAIACLEAIACGLVPVISASGKSATPKFALDERSLFKAGDPQDLAAKIDYWIEHEAQRKEMERKYAERGKAYNIHRCVARIEDMFKQAIFEATGQPAGEPVYEADEVEAYALGE